MYHPLYYQAQRCVGRPVYLHHMNGRSYHGTIISTNPRGVYLVQHPAGTTMASASSTDWKVDTAQGSDNSTVELVYSPAAFFGFGALTGLTLGAAAGLMW